ncbi:MAG: hypothetical protein GX444_21175 [Myxococcales bacterium]|nr:hypothetical protein [Myxococcales bacterium]
MDRDSFKFNLRRLIEKAKKFPFKAEGVTVSLPLVSIKVIPDRVERDVAREVVIRLADKRVLNAWECCDGCIKNAMDSIQEIRNFLVDMEVKLKDKTDTALYLLIEFMLEGVRQFLSYTETQGPQLQRQGYFDALNILRPHLYRCLSQVALVANMEMPTIPTHMRFDLKWDERHYLKDSTSDPQGPKELPSNVIPIRGSKLGKRVKVVGSGNVVAGGDINVAGDMNIKYASGRGKKSPPIIIAGTVATDAYRYNYLEHLVGRYNEYKKAECDRTGQAMKYALIRNAYLREFGCKVKDTPLDRFEDAVAYLQYRIADTALGRNYRKQGRRLFSTFEEFCQK